MKKRKTSRDMIWRFLKNPNDPACTAFRAAFQEDIKASDEGQQWIQEAKRQCTLLRLEADRSFVKTLRKNPSRMLSRVLTVSIFVSAILCCFLISQIIILQLLKKPEAIHCSAGGKWGKRAEVALFIAEVAKKYGLSVETTPVDGTYEMLDGLINHKLDFCWVQGDIELPAHVRVIAAYNDEVLHLLVRPEVAEFIRRQGLATSLRGRTINLSTTASGTRVDAKEVLQQFGLEYNKDYIPGHLSYSELMTLSPERLCDATFAYSLIPSPVVDHLVRDRGYVLTDIPVGRALSERNSADKEVTIPAYTYGAGQPKDIHTVGANLLLVARDDLPDAVMGRLVAAAYDKDFWLRANLHEPDTGTIQRSGFPVAKPVVAWRQSQGTPSKESYSLLAAIFGLISGIILIAANGFSLFCSNIIKTAFENKENKRYA